MTYDLTSFSRVVAGLTIYGNSQHLESFSVFIDSFSVIYLPVSFLFSYKKRKKKNDAKKYFTKTGDSSIIVVLLLRIFFVLFCRNITVYSLSSIVFYLCYF